MMRTPFSQESHSKNFSYSHFSKCPNSHFENYFVAAVAGIGRVGGPAWPTWRRRCKPAAVEDWPNRLRPVVVEVVGVGNPGVKLGFLMEQKKCVSVWFASVSNLHHGL